MEVPPDTQDQKSESMLKLEDVSTCIWAQLMLCKLHQAWEAISAQGVGDHASSRE